MNTYQLLSLDESGKAAFSHPSELFILTGVVIPETLKPQIDRKMRKIKAKYFGNEELVFHGRDMARRAGAFSALKDPKMEKQFWGEGISIINDPELALYFVLTNKAHAQKAGWKAQTILRRSYLRLLEEFVRNLKLSGSCGRITNESDTEQDPYLMYAHNRLQGMGTGDGAVSGSEYKHLVTSLSLVNKANLDIDVQIADMVGFVARLKYLKEQTGTVGVLSAAERMRLRLIERKIHSPQNPGLFEVLI